MFVLLTGLALAAPSDLPGVLACELPGWDASPREAVEGDTEVFHGGARALRLESVNPSRRATVEIWRALGVRFGGEELVLTGWVRTEEARGGAALWLRQDGPAGALEQVESEVLRGTADWTQLSLRARLRPETTTLTIGGRLRRDGRAWLDDIALTIDGKPVWEAPIRADLLTALDTDHAFDEGSGVRLPELSPTQVEDLVLLGKVWGFLKAHHPAVTRGELHWDYELFRVLPKVLAAPDSRVVLAEWIASLGALPPCDPCASEPKDPVLAADLAWIHDTAALGESLSRALVEVWARRPADGRSVWVSLTPSIGNPDLSFERAYVHIDVTADDGYRLLALYRFWSLIEHWFPYRDLLDTDWDEVLRRALPEIAAARDEVAFARAMLRVAAEVKDTHTNLWSGLEHRPPDGACTVAVHPRFLGDELVVWRPWDASPGLEPGDRVVSIDGVAPLELVRRWSPLYAASNEAARRRDIARSILEGECAPARLGVLRGDQALELEIPRVAVDMARAWTFHDRPGQALQWLGDEVAYLKMSAYEAGSGREIVKAIKGSRGLIIDLRGYPSAFGVFDLGQHLVREPTPFARFTVADLANPGTFDWTGPAIELEPRRPHYDGAVVILVDETTQSQAEYTAQAFRAAPGAIVVGSTTAGADGNVSRLRLPGGHELMITGIGTFYPDGSPTQRVGIVPDVELRPTVEGLREGRDEVLEEALRQILGASSGSPARAFAPTSTRAAGSSTWPRWPRSRGRSRAGRGRPRGSAAGDVLLVEPGDLRRLPVGPAQVVAVDAVAGAVQLLSLRAAVVELAHQRPQAGVPGPVPGDDVVVRGVADAHGVAGDVPEDVVLDAVVAAPVPRVDRVDQARPGRRAPDRAVLQALEDVVGDGRPRHAAHQHPGGAEAPLRPAGLRVGGVLAAQILEAVVLDDRALDEGVEPAVVLVGLARRRLGGELDPARLVAADREAAHLEIGRRRVILRALHGGAVGEEPALGGLAVPAPAHGGALAVDHQLLVRVVIGPVRLLALPDRRALRDRDLEHGLVGHGAARPLALGDQPVVDLLQGAEALTQELVGPLGALRGARRHRRRGLRAELLLGEGVAQVLLLVELGGGGLRLGGGAGGVSDVVLHRRCGPPRVGRVGARKILVSGPVQVGHREGARPAAGVESAQRPPLSKPIARWVPSQ